MIKPRTKTPDLTIDLVDGKTWTLSEQDPEHFTMIIVYRGKHCPVCKTYLKTLEKHMQDFKDKGVSVIAISANTKELATASVKEWDIPNVPVGYNFSIEEARTWGLFISEGIKDEPKVFVEPGLYLIRPDRTLYASSIQTMPFARPSLEDLLKSLDFVIDKDYPARGEA
ncbi:alkyl hydroperoxide reductase [Formosa agariphila KMM 3901]|uniref:Alkyl hydroperoxide reductase n=1 Tax=Formosa agariphila (strain DSM 15362 / KCTC 12365 / LMG 23005 / KMM 3901 / M-2Alg 35-1) TaxID=1347342 RepID=T2KK49_FORAG|nr:peroxiredoxin-like family protein [Formosa agariphila]CDF79272.1 alkyl hydroperoxide reductase [Formosa agariphila KMM 3901]